MVPEPGRPIIESPSFATADQPAYELKFLLPLVQAHAVEQRLKGRLELDSHADPRLGNAYHTTSLYLDTPRLDVFHRVGAGRRRKQRVRRYGDGPWFFLERKDKRGDRVRKQRTPVPRDELALLALPMSAVDWQGHWYHRYLLRRNLAPVCRIAYERVAYTGLSAEGPLRITFDRHIRGIACRDWSVDSFDGGLPILTEQVVCELKYRVCLPLLFKEIVHALQLTPSPVSKYRTFMRAAGLADALGTGNA